MVARRASAAGPDVNSVWALRLTPLSEYLDPQQIIYLSVIIYVSQKYLIYC